MSGVIAAMAPLVVFLALAWLAVLVAAPYLPAAPAAVTYLLGAQICHQIAERSFHLAGAQLPVCARCTGIYAGFAAGVVWASVSRRVAGSDPTFPQRGQTPVEKWGQTPARARVAIAALPTIVTLLAEWAGLWQTSNVTRAIAGAPLGGAVGLVVLAAAGASQPIPDPRIANRDS